VGRERALHRMLYLSQLYRLQGRREKGEGRMEKGEGRKEKGTVGDDVLV
jgi:hypothetical protein